eukprot:Sspe_Gene.93594::Locus_66188_Transcript_2_2_Confidence_0.600_Length_917::g.93594::m.93594
MRLHADIFHSLEVKKRELDTGVPACNLTPNHRKSSPPPPPRRSTVRVMDTPPPPVTPHRYKLSGAPDPPPPPTFLVPDRGGLSSCDPVSSWLLTSADGASTMSLAETEVPWSSRSTISTPGKTRSRNEPRLARSRSTGSTKEREKVCDANSRQVHRKQRWHENDARIVSLLQTMSADRQKVERAMTRLGKALGGQGTS